MTSYWDSWGSIISGAPENKKQEILKIVRKLYDRLGPHKVAVDSVDLYPYKTVISMVKGLSEDGTDWYTAKFLLGEFPSDLHSYDHEHKQVIAYYLAEKYPITEVLSDLGIHVESYEVNSHRYYEKLKDAGWTR